MKDKIKAVMLGHAVADALGVPVEFCSREELDENPVTDMLGGGTYGMPAGAWSDDTSMSLCALESLAKGQLNYGDIMLNFGKWYYEDEFTPTGEMFDVGNTSSFAIDDYFSYGKSISECGRSGDRDNGNGSLMRIHPFVLYLISKYGLLNDACLQVIFNASALTHAHRRSQVGCAIYACVLESLLKMPSKASVVLGLGKAKTLLANEPELETYSRLFAGDLSALPRESIKSGGYVVTTLEAALWCLLTSDSYEECVLKAVNLGDDTDTVGAVAGGLAGALYGYDAIPTSWINTLLRRDYIEDMCDRAYSAWGEKS